MLCIYLKFSALFKMNSIWRHNNEKNPTKTHCTVYVYTHYYNVLQTSEFVFDMNSKINFNDRKLQYLLNIV